MKPSLLFVHLRQSRRTSLLLFAGTLATLVVAAVWFVSARSSLADAYARLGTRTQMLSEAQVREQEARLRVEYAESARQLLGNAHAHGLQPNAWGERLINLRQSQMSREEAAAMIRTVTRGSDLLFGAEAFELSVTQQEEGLFDVPNAADRRPAPLSLTLRGSLVFRTGAVSSLDTTGVLP